MTENIITPPVLTEAALSRVKHFAKHNAFIALTEDLAKKRAKESQERYNDNKPLSEIDGLPIAIKDNFCTKEVIQYILLIK